MVWMFFFSGNEYWTTIDFIFIPFFCWQQIACFFAWLEFFCVCLNIVSFFFCCSTRLSNDSRHHIVLDMKTYRLEMVRHENKIKKKKNKKLSVHTSASCSSSANAFYSMLPLRHLKYIFLSKNSVPDRFRWILADGHIIIHPQIQTWNLFYCGLWKA